MLFNLLSALFFLSVPQITDSTETLEQAAITGSRVPMTLGQSARIVTVIDSLDIAASPVETVNDLLKMVVGVDVRQRGSEGMQTDISMRGGSFDQIAVLLDGINICDPQTGHNAMDIPVAMSEIDHIEVLEGPAARVYGTSSLVGAINIVTRAAAGAIPRNRTGYNLSAEGGSFAYGKIENALTIDRGPLSFSISAGASRSDGYTKSSAGNPNTDFGTVKLSFRMGYRAKAADISLHIAACQKNRGSGNFYSLKFDNQFEHTSKDFVSLKAETKGRVHFRPQFYWNRGRDRFELVRGAADIYPYNYHRTDVFGANIGAWTEWKLGKTAAGVEIRREGIVSTNLGEPLADAIKVEHADASYTHGIGRTNISIYADHSLILSRFTFSAGVAVVKNTGSGEPFRLYPGAEAGWRFAPSWKLYTSVNTSLRMPTFTELYYSVGGHKADRNLKAEKMSALELGLKYGTGAVNATACVYRHHGTDMIDWIRKDETEDWRSVNHAVINTLGEEISLRFNLPRLLGMSGFPVHSLNLGYSHINQNKEPAPGVRSRYALEYLRNKMTAQAIAVLPWDINLTLSAQFMDRTGSFDYKPYTLLSARLNKKFGVFSVYAEGQNLLNTHYYDFGEIPQPGINARVGAIVSIL